MNTLWKRLDKRNLPAAAAFLALFAAGMLYVFAPALPVNITTLSPDAAKFFPTAWFARWAESFLAGRYTCAPLSLLRFLGHPLWRLELFYILASLGAALGIAYYLRTQRVSRGAAYGAGLLFAFSGYSLTLFNAGHNGYFNLISCVPFAFGLLSRCFETRRPHLFALLGCVIAWSEFFQPDIWLLFMLLLGAYGLWLTFRHVRAGRGADVLRRVYPRFLLTLALTALVGGGNLRGAATDTVADRKAQMAGAAAGREKAAGDISRSRENWIFATNWSLPPEDILEFLVPGIFGDDSLPQPTAHPYWGRLGRPANFQKGRMMPNYRQHTVYLGAVILLLALAGCLGWRAAAKQTDTPDAPASPPSPDAAPAGPDFSDVPFWLAACVVCTLFALGRHTPVYRLFYSLPYMNLIRCPVKFHHLTETGAAALAGFGLEALASRRLRSSAGRAWVAGAAACAALAAGLLGCIAAGPRISAHIASLGMAPYAAALARYACLNTVRALAVAAAATLLLARLAARSTSAKQAALLAWALAALGTADLAGVARRYVEPIDIGPHHAENAVVRALAKQTGGKPALVLNFVTGGPRERDWFGTSLALHGFANAAPTQNDSVLRTVFSACSPDNLPAYWKWAGARFILLPYRQGAALANSGEAEPLGLFELGAGVVRTLRAPSEKAVLLLALRDAVPLPALHPAWAGGVAPENQLAAITGKTARPLPVADAPAPEKPAAPDAAPAPAPRPVSFPVMRGMPGALATDGEVENPGAAAALLVFPEKFRPGAWAARVDGAPARVFQADARWAAILVPPGRHRVRFTAVRRPLLPILSLLAGLAAAAWAWTCRERQS